jgi:hypothetical protein
VKRYAAVSLLIVALMVMTVAPSFAGHHGHRHRHHHHGRFFIGGPVWWGPSYYPYYPPGPYYNYRDEAERRAMAQVRLTSEVALLSGCTRLGAVKDDDVEDLRRKVVRAGGNAAALSFGVDDLETIAADVYRCTTTAKAPAAGSAPASSKTPPPPPAGTPPPPPPPAGTPPPPPPAAEPTR